MALQDVNSARHGFKLLEVVLVILLLAILAGLLLPAVQIARSGPRMRCGNNLKNIALAAHNYHDVYDCFPPAFLEFSGKLRSDGEPNRLSGLYCLLPFVEQQPLHTTIFGGGNFGAALTDESYHYWKTDIATFRCTDFPYDESIFAQANYAFCIGDLARNLSAASVQRGIFAGEMTSTVRNIHDGTSNTIMFAEIGNELGRSVIGQYVTNQPESIFSAPSRALSLRSVDDPKRYDDHVRLGWRGRGGCWADGSPAVLQFNTILPPNSPSCTTVIGSTGDGLYSAGSQHPGGINVAFADGTVHFISNDIDCGDLSHPLPDEERFREGRLESLYGVWGALGTIDEGESVKIP